MALEKLKELDPIFQKPYDPELAPKLYNPQRPMENRITDIGPPYFWQFMPPIVQKNFGKWKSHQIIQPGVIKRVSETGDVICSKMWDSKIGDN